MQLYPLDEAGRINDVSIPHRDLCSLQLAGSSSESSFSSFQSLIGIYAHCNSNPWDEGENWQGFNPS